MKKNKESYPLPEEGSLYRPSYSLGLWLTALHALSIIIPMSVPASVGLAIATEPFVALLVVIIMPVGILVPFMIAWPVAALIGRCHRPHACLSEGRLYLTDRKRAVSVADITALELYLGCFSKHHPRPPRLTLRLPHNDTFEITRPSLRLLRDIRRAAPKAAFSANWKDTLLFESIAGFVGGVVVAVVLLVKS